MPLYLVDANTLIQADEDYYPLDRVPQYWDWLIEVGKKGLVKMPFEVYDEIASSPKPTALRQWIKSEEFTAHLLLDEKVDNELFNRVLDTCYAPDLTDEELERAGRDPFLIAYALVDQGRVVVSKEVSKVTQTRGRRRVPDACRDVGIRCVDDFAMLRLLDFRIVT